MTVLQGKGVTAMVGIVLVSHSEALVSALHDYTKVIAPNAPVALAGGMPDGSFGTSYARVRAAINRVNGPDGVIVLMDMGASAAIVKMVLTDLHDPDVCMADCPFVEGAVEATVQSQASIDRDSIMQSLRSLSSLRKF